MNRMKIILILTFIFFSQKAFSFIDYTYLVCKKETEIIDKLKINENFIFFTLKQGNYLEQIIKINKDKQNISIFEIINKSGDYKFDDKLITLRENLFFRKIKFKKELSRQSLNLTTYKNKKVSDNHICTKTNYTDYKTKINDIISTLKESWKNEYKNNKM